MKRLLSLCLLITLLYSTSSALAAGTNSDTYVIDKNQSSHHEVTLQFGSPIAELIYEVMNHRFILEQALRIDGDNAIVGNLYVALNHNAANSIGSLLLGRDHNVWQSLSWDTSTDRFEFSNDVNIQGNLTVNGSPVGGGGNGHTPSFSRIKLLPQSFTVYGENGGMGGVFDHGASQMAEYGSYGIISSIAIPEGYRATKGRIYGNGAFQVSFYECQLNSTTCTSLGSGPINGVINFTDVDSTDNNFLSVIVDETRYRPNSEMFQGGYIELEEMN